MDWVDDLLYSVLLGCFDRRSVRFLGGGVYLETHPDQLPELARILSSQFGDEWAQFWNRLSLADLDAHPFHRT